MALDVSKCSSSGVIDWNNILTAVIHNLKAALPTKNQYHFWVPEQFT